MTTVKGRILEEYFVSFSEVYFPHCMVRELKALLNKACKCGLQRNTGKKNEKELSIEILISDILKTPGFVIIYLGLPCSV